MSQTAKLRVEKAGPQALLQDAGRFGVRHLGMTQGGPMDWHAAGWANALLGNPMLAPVLEIAMGGLTLKAEADVTLALCGADLAARVNDQALAPWQRFELSKGDCLTFDLPRSGMRAYLAAPGGWSGSSDLGSVACVTREGLGGHKGGGVALEAGDELQCPSGQTGKYPALQQVPEASRIDYQQPARLGLIPAGQVAAFDGRSLYEAFNSEWHVDTRADRMGIHLSGPELTGRLPAMVSEGIAPGSVQVPPDGQPICLMNDRQTIGGYPRLGTLSPIGRARLAQCAPGHPVFLAACGSGAARAEWQAVIKAITAFGAIRS